MTGPVDLEAPPARRSWTTALSRQVAHALRHQPERYGIVLDEHGWVSVADLVAGLSSVSPRWRRLTAADITTMVDQATKRRYELAGGRIRARYGHSLPQRLPMPPAAPPPELFHGTDPGQAAAILAEGLRPMGRQYVHLSTNPAGARAVGRRKSRTPVVFRLDAQAAAQAGVSFYSGGEDVWLADRVPAEFLQRLTADR